MIISFSNIPFILACIVGVLILFSHISHVFLKERISRVLRFIGVLLYPIGIILLFFAGASFDLCVACVLACVLVYTLASSISHKRKEGSVTK